MQDQHVTCPNCGTSIPVTKMLTEELEQKLKLDLEAEKKKLWVIAQQKAAEKQGKQLTELEDQLKESTKKLAESEKNELDLRKKSRDLEEREKKIELELARKVDEERVKITNRIKKEEAENQHLKLQEKDKQLDIMRKQIDELKRKAEQGSMQIQGEVQEDELKNLLTVAFVTDEISDVPTGISGADLIQKVNAKMGAQSGTILWESKNTKAFSEGWISKLKQDQGTVSADCAILVTQVLPADITSFGLKNGVWIVGYQHCVALAKALRLHIGELAKVKQSLVGRDEKMELLYQYLAGPQFKNRIENIVMAFVSMKQDLEAERRAFQRIWSKRDKDLEKVIGSTSTLYGDLQGIIGGSLPTIQQLELTPGEEVSPTLFEQ